jgi:septal ring factor EnvC (AmiA/AmiB activator)
MATRLLSVVTGLLVVIGINAEPGPITKVLSLLKDMQKELEAEADKDKETYEKLKCWCDTNGAGKTQAVKDQKDKIDELNSLIEGSTAKKSELTTEIGQLEKDIADAKQALAEATEIRKKEAAEFHTEETELLKSVTLLKGAIVALSKHHTGLLQSDSELMSMRPALRKMLHQNLKHLDWLSASADKESLLGFLSQARSSEYFSK